MGQTPDNGTNKEEENITIFNEACLVKLLCYLDVIPSNKSVGMKQDRLEDHRSRRCASERAEVREGGKGANAEAFVGRRWPRIVQRRARDGGGVL